MPAKKRPTLPTRTQVRTGTTSGVTSKTKVDKGKAPATPVDKGTAPITPAPGPSGVTTEAAGPSGSAATRGLPALAKYVADRFRTGWASLTQESPAKTKRRQHRLTSSLTDRKLAKLNAKADRKILEQIYLEFYAKGERKNSDDELDRQLKAALYNLMGKGSADYLRKPVTPEEFEAFLSTKNTEITAQDKSDDINKAHRTAMTDYERKRAAWNRRPRDKRRKKPIKPDKPSESDPALLRAAVATGDYFHLSNTSGKLIDDGKIGKARRIVVNVNNQQAGLRVAKKVTDLFDEDAVSPYLRDVKIYLSQAKPSPDAKVKHDKLVIYYRLPDDATPAEDEVGDRIVAAIKGAVRPRDVGGKFAPFYARVGKGIAWAEEPKYFVDSLEGSFTESRETIIADVIRGARQVPDLDAFIARVSTAFEVAYIDPKHPHRHLPNAPRPQPRQKRQRGAARRTGPATTSGGRPTVDAVDAMAARPAAEGEPAGAGPSTSKPVTKMSTMPPPPQPLPPLPSPSTPTGSVAT